MMEWYTRKERNGDVEHIMLIDIRKPDQSVGSYSAYYVIVRPWRQGFIWSIRGYLSDGETHTLATFNKGVPLEEARKHALKTAKVLLEKEMKNVAKDIKSFTKNVTSILGELDQHIDSHTCEKEE